MREGVTSVKRTTRTYTIPPPTRLRAARARSPADRATGRASYSLRLTPRRYNSLPFGYARASGSRSEPVLGVLPVESLTGFPGGPLVSLGRESSRAPQQTCEVHQIPRHEGRIAVGEVVFRPARSRVE